MPDPAPRPEPRLIGTLQEIAAWREATEASATAKVEEVNQEESKLNDELAQLQARLSKLRKERTRLKKELRDLDGEELRRSHAAVIESLQGDRALVEERAKLYADAEAASQKKVEEMLSDASLASALEDYDAFAEAEAGLAALPASYRKAILSHHEEVKTQLEPLFQEMRGENLSVEAKPAAASVIASVAYDGEQPEVLVLVIPVEAAFLESWERREQDLSASLAYRMMAAAVRIAARLGAPDAPIRHKGFEDHVAIWVWLRDSVIDGDLRAVTQEEVAAAHERARELNLTQLELIPLWLPADILQEPESDPDTTSAGDERLSASNAQTSPGEPVGDDDTEDEEIPAAVIAEEEPIPGFTVSEGE